MFCNVRASDAENRATNAIVPDCEHNEGGRIDKRIVNCDRRLSSNTTDDDAGEGSLIIFRRLGQETIIETSCDCNICLSF